jgi:hypothetical protein
MDSESIRSTNTTASEDVMAVEFVLPVIGLLLIVCSLCGLLGCAIYQFRRRVAHQQAAAEGTIHSVSSSHQSGLYNNTFLDIGVAEDITISTSETRQTEASLVID